MKIADAEPGTIVMPVGFRGTHRSTREFVKGEVTAYVVKDIVEVPAKPSVKSYRRPGDRPTVKRIRTLQVRWNSSTGRLDETSNERDFAPARLFPMHGSRVKEVIEKTLREVEVSVAEHARTAKAVQDDATESLDALVTLLDRDSRGSLVSDYRLKSVHRRDERISVMLSPGDLERIADALAYFEGASK